MLSDERLGYEIVEAFLQLHSKICVYYEKDTITSEFVLNSIHDKKFGLSIRTQKAFKDLIEAIEQDNDDDYS